MLLDPLKGLSNAIIRYLQDHDIYVRSYVRTKLRSRPASWGYRSDGLATQHNHDFMDDPAFITARQRGLQACGELPKRLAVGVEGMYWRLHLGLWAASHAMQLPGSFVECGVDYGFLSSAIMHYLNWNERDKLFYLFDTFCGLDASLVSPEEFALGRMDFSREVYPECYEKVKKNFEEYNNVVLVRGSIPSTLSTVEIPTVCYLHIDMNCAEPEIQAAQFFWPKMVKGGVVLLDDYAYVGYEPQKKAFDHFAKENDISILSLPTGQGMFLKA